jgi:O-antigen/teichoic acid export membrane protein
LKRPQSLKLSASAQTLPIVIGYGANLIGTPFVVASLGLTNFGLWALTGAVAQYGVLLDLGVSRAIVRYVALYHTQKDKDKERAIVGGCVMVIVIMGCLLMCFPLFIPAQLGHLIGAQNTNLARLLFISSIVVLITGVLGAIFAGASIGRGRTVAVNIGVAVQRAGVVIGGVIAIIFNPTLGYFAVGSAVGGAIGLIVVLIAILVDEHEIRIGRPRVTIMRDLISFSLKGQVMSVSEIVLFQSGKLLAGIIIGPAAAGAYELGSRLALGARAFGTSASSVLSAHLTRGYALNGVAEIRRDYARLVQRNAAVSNFALLFLTATSFSVVPVWLGINHVDVVWVVIALTLAYTVNVSTGVTIAAAFALNQLGIVTVTAIGGSLLAVALELPLAHVAGLKGILIGMALAIVISALFGLIMIHRGNGIPLTDFFEPVTGPFIVGGVSTVLAMSVGIFSFPMDRPSAIVPFLCSAGIFCAVYTTLGWRLGYLPTIKGITAWRTRRAGMSLADD